MNSIDYNISKIGVTQRRIIENIIYHGGVAADFEQIWKREGQIACCFEIINGKLKVNLSHIRKSLNGLVENGIVIEKEGTYSLNPAYQNFCSQITRERRW